MCFRYPTVIETLALSQLSAPSPCKRCALASYPLWIYLQIWWLKLYQGRNILSEPYFTDLHLSRSSEVIIFHQASNSEEYDHEYMDDDDEFGNLALVELDGDEFGNLALVELDDERDQHDIHHDPLMRFSLGFDYEYYVMCLSGSVNGLICLEDSYDDAAYVCNPITQEYILLQDSDYTRESFLKRNYGFGFVESNNQYKIVRFYKVSLPSTEGSYNLGSEVYTLGTGMWRDLGRVPFHLNGYDIGMYVSGNLHWLADEVNQVICTFDLDKELFHPMEAPPRPSGLRVTYRSLGVLKGCLCICDNIPYSELAIWVMREYGVEDGWSKELVTLTHLIHGGIHNDRVRLLKVLKDGNILMYCETFQLFTYHPRYQTLQHHIFPEGDFSTFDAMTYVPSFIRLERFTGEFVAGW